MIKRPISQHLVRFADCDPMGHLHSSHFLQYFLHAREDHLREHYDMSLHDYTAKTGNAWMLVRNQISYFREAKLMETIWIESRLISMDDKLTRVEMLMLDKSRTRIKAHLWVDFIHISVHTKKVVAHPIEVHTQLKKMLDPIQEVIFEKRTESLRNASRKDRE